MTPAAPRRLLVAVTGLTPQIVTETLHALACDRPNPWIPHEVHLITTAIGADNARLNLLAGERRFHRLRADYGLPPILFTPEQIHVLQDAGASRSTTSAPRPTTPGRRTSSPRPCAS